MRPRSCTWCWCVLSIACLAKACSCIWVDHRVWSVAQGHLSVTGAHVPGLPRVRVCRMPMPAMAAVQSCGGCVDTPSQRGPGVAALWYVRQAADVAGHVWREHGRALHAHVCFVERRSRHLAPRKASDHTQSMLDGRLKSCVAAGCLRLRPSFCVCILPLLAEQEYAWFAFNACGSTAASSGRSCCHQSAAPQQQLVGRSCGVLRLP